MEPILAETLTRWRRHLHANPGLTLNEGATAAFVVEKLRELGVTDITEGVGGHGVVATLQRPGSNRSVGLRGDMDALPIEEAAADLPWRSTVPGVMHACGHDGHTTALLGAAAVLMRDPDWTGTVRLVFQPAEEGGGGAEAMIRDGLFQRFPMDRIFGWHNWPGLAAGTVAVHDGPVMAAGNRFKIDIEGHAGHAALPHLARDPIVAAGHVIVACQSIVARTLDPLDTGVVSLTTVHGGEAQNQIAARVEIKGSMRYLRKEVGDQIFQGLQRIAEGVTATFGVKAQAILQGGVPVTVNHKAEADMAAEAAGAVTAVRRDIPPAMTGEDFSHFLHHVPGAFVWIGNGPADGGRELHNPHYDFNDAVLPAASGFLAEVARRALAKED
ncbi:amidohydrolase [Roseomonas marmotae]|uniref:Amidohydrolase n=1 Tax=Roseomonas marmotae TaxID=2768161 RepID=A0ABS3KBD4_9PROT|nr:amidohydrolase [Roseomonas marmotae]MBO1074297.1 amidohydrolase [Roseomonas marmotae]QTI78051.1 amidohydrolase [Roseomonas marmotae]